MKISLMALGSVVLLAFHASTSLAQNQRSFVSGLGSDSNPCSRTAPCRTFAQAISQTTSSGEVYVLDSAGYGPFTITQRISIVAPPGVAAGISVFSGDGVTINAGGTDTIILRGLTLNNQFSSGNGITFNTGGVLHVENCVVNGFNEGLLDQAPNSTLEVKDSIFRDNFIGVFILPTSGSAHATLDQVRLEASTEGIEVREGSSVTIRNSVASGNTNGMFVVSSTSANCDLNIESCTISNNSNAGIEADSESTGVPTVRVSNCVVTGNRSGLQNDGAPAVLLSRGNNTVEGNTTNTFGTIGSYSAK